MLGEELQACELTGRGFVGDRAYALVDSENGKVASIKNPRKWARLFECRAEFLDGARAVRITLPDGETVSAAEPEAAELLSTLFSRRATLETSAAGAPVLEELWLDGSPDGRAVTDETFARGSPPGTFFDYGVVHLVTTATLARLARAVSGGAFRPTAIPAESSSSSRNRATAGSSRTPGSGRRSRSATTVRLAVTDPCRAGA